MHLRRQRRLCLLAAWIVCLTQPVAGPPRAAADEAKGEAPQVTFLDKAAAAKAVVDDSAEPYFDKLQPAEMSAKTGKPITGDTLDAQRAEARRRYAAGTLDFNEAER